jgi:SHS2 domain-containing protein
VPYQFLDDVPTADVGFRAWGATLDECFRGATDATRAVMLDNATDLQPRQRRTLRVEADGLDLALLRLLEELIFYKDAESLFLRVQETADGWDATVVLDV